MSIAVIKQRLATASPRSRTRIAGLAYVTVVAVVMFAGLSVHGTVVSPIDGDSVNVLTAFKAVQLQTFASAFLRLYAKGIAVTATCHCLLIAVLLVKSAFLRRSGS